MQRIDDTIVNDAADAEAGPRLSPGLTLSPTPSTAEALGWVSYVGGRAGTRRSHGVGRARRQLEEIESRQE